MKQLLLFIAILQVVLFHTASCGSLSVLGNTMTIDWTETETEVTFSVQGTGQWIGFGFGSAMLKSDAVIAWAGSSPSINEYYLGKKQTCSQGQGVCLMSELGHQVLFQNGTVGTEGGKTVMTFVRPRVSNDNFHKSLTGKTFSIVYAQGDLPLDYHLSRGASSITLSTGSGGSSGASTSPFIVAHGVMMFLAWCVFIPLGVFLAAFGKGIGVWWFRLHAIFQTTAVILALTAFFVIIAYVQNEGSTHFQIGHAILGLIITIVLVITPFVGVLANKMWDENRKGTPIFPDLFHWGLSYSAIICAFVNVFLGLSLANASIVLVGLMAGWTALLVLLYIALTIKRIKSSGK